MPKPTQDQIDVWLSGVVPTRWVHLRRVWRYIILPKLIKYEPSASGLFFGLLRLACLVAISCVPIFVKWIDGSLKIGWFWTICAALTILIMQLYCLFYDNALSFKKVMKQRRALHTIASLTTMNAIYTLSKVVKSRARTECDIHGRVLVKEVLVCIQHILAAHVDEDVGKTQACLMLFADDDCKSLCVYERAKNIRPVGVSMPTEETMAYQIMKTKKHYVLYDFLTDHPFDKTGISDPRPTYRSVLFIPLIQKSTNGEKDSCFGMLTVETEKPYQFWFGEGDRLAIKLAPYEGWLRLILQQDIVKCPSIPLE